jgi:delta1-piperideine-2-carboxylate reductase
MDVRVAFDELLDLVTQVLVRHGASAENAAAVARACVSAERDGAKSHGLFRLKGYVGSLRSGWVDGQAEPVVERVGNGAVLRVDARNGFAQPALAKAAPTAVQVTRSLGVCLVAIRDSHHLAALWPDVEDFARQGLIAMAFVNSVARVVPWGGRSAIYGTNPMAFAVPRSEAPPLVFDQASSSMAFGDVRLAAEAGETLPAHVGVDREGRATNDPAAVLDGGALLPFGGHKGSSIAMMVEVLVAALAGGNFSFEVDLQAHPGAETPRTGEVVIVIDPDAGAAGFKDRVETLVDRLRVDGVTRLPGDRRYAARNAAEAGGLIVARSVVNDLRALLASS